MLARSRTESKVGVWTSLEKRVSFIPDDPVYAHFLGG